MALTNLDLDTLRTLVIAYDLGGYGRAAERLGRTPSAISLQMKRLQQDVGAILFRKDGRNLALTEIGEMVLRYGRRILELNDEMLDTVRGASLAGTVRLGFAQDFAETVLPQALSRFTELNPLMQIDARIDRNAALVNAIENGQREVLPHAQLRRKAASMTVLRHVPDPTVQNGIHVTGRDGLPIHHDRPRGGLDESNHRVGDGGAARTFEADETQAFTSADVEADVGD